MFWEQVPAIKSAIDANNYTAFIIARNADSNKPANAKIPNQAEFDKMIVQSKRQGAIEIAIADNDYNAFVEASKPTQWEFDKMVVQYNTRIAIDTAIKANDYTAFTTAWNANTNRPANATVPTQAEFDKMVERKATKTNTTQQ